MVLNRMVLVGLLCGVAGAGACTTVRRVQLAEYFAEHNPEVVWVTRTNNTVIPVAEPVISRGALKGVWQGRQERVAIPLSEIGSVRAKVHDRRKTALLLTALGVAAVSTLYVGFISKTGPGGDGTNCGLDRKGDVIQDC